MSGKGPPDGRPWRARRVTPLLRGHFWPRGHGLGPDPRSWPAGAGSQPALEVRAHLGPVVVDDRVPRRVAELAVANEHVLAEDPLETGWQRLERAPRGLVQRVGLELDAHAAVPL